MKIEVRRGERGRWRWFAYEDRAGEPHEVAQSPPNGFDTEAAAREAAARVIGPPAVQVWAGLGAAALVGALIVVIIGGV